MQNPKPKIKFSIVQSEILWMGIGCYLVKYYLNSKDALDNFGTWITIAKQLNISAMVILGILSGKKFFDFVIMFYISKTPKGMSEAVDKFKDEGKE